MVLFDALRLTVDGCAALLSGWLAFIFYYDPFQFVPLSTVLIFFQSPDDQYAKLAVLAGLIFALVTFVKYGRVPVDRRFQKIVPAWCVTLLIVVGILST